MLPTVAITVPNAEMTLDLEVKVLTSLASVTGRTGGSTACYPIVPRCSERLKYKMPVQAVDGR
jgi:hypothetical protein